jgi:hypothetical protein
MAWGHSQTPMERTTVCAGTISVMLVNAHRAQAHNRLTCLQEILECMYVFIQICYFWACLCVCYVFHVCACVMRCCISVGDQWWACLMSTMSTFSVMSVLDVNHVDILTRMFHKHYEARALCLHVPKHRKSRRVRWQGRRSQQRINGLCTTMLVFFAYKNTWCVLHIWHTCARMSGERRRLTDYRVHDRGYCQNEKDVRPALGRVKHNNRHRQQRWHHRPHLRVFV